MKTAAILLTCLAILTGALFVLLDNAWHAYAAANLCVVLTAAAALAWLLLWLNPRSPAGAGAQSPPRRPAPAGHHRTRR